MIYALCSPKGGTGVTTCTIGFAAAAAQSHSSVIVDLAGDLPVGVGLSGRSARDGIIDWVSRRDHVNSDALKSLQVPLTSQLSLISRGGSGTESLTKADADSLLAALGTFENCFIDLGVMGNDVFRTRIAQRADASFLVMRLCYLGLHRASQMQFRPTGLVLVAEPGRALHRRDIEDAMGISVVASIPYDPSIARALDAGVLHSRTPRIFERSWRSVPGERAA